MRPELARLIAMSWANKTRGLHDHASSILKLKAIRATNGTAGTLARLVWISGRHGGSNGGSPGMLS